MNAEQWLSDLEAKAAKALFICGHPSTDDPSSPVDCADIDACEIQAFFDAATPAAVNRLVAIVRYIANRAGEYTSTCPFKNGIPPNLWPCHGVGMPCAHAEKCEIQHAYQQTEPKPCASQHIRE